MEAKLATPKELGGAGGPGNNPEQLFAMGYAACFVGAMKAVAPGRTSVSAGTPVAAAFSISPRAAVGDIPPGWTLSIDAAISAALMPGNYLADARLDVGGGVIITETVAIALRESVSA